MEIFEVDSKQYADIFSKPYHFFNAAAFNAINAYKCEQVFYLIFKDSKTRLGIIFGLRDNKLVSPFSAPFGGFESASDDIRLQQIDAALEALITWATSKKIQGMRIVSPSFFYNENFLNKIYNCLYRAGFESNNIELNYQFPTQKFTENYQNEIWYNARKNLKRAFQAELTFEKLANENAKEAYDVIAQNRKERGFPLRMTWEQVQETMTVMTADFFLVKKDETPIGAAVVFHVAHQMVQVIYWGDLPQYSEYKTMNFLSFHLFQYYKQQGIKIIDIGPSTEDSVPNYGLCEFKESIGCDISIKTEFYKKLQ
ncbi:GNAT family N-acetyltransferase [Flavobacterium sp.]|uniref:GNAT family N-acetyltransferase n=1 Tax=Flavobacterium sp. TaxID=239 RepID=UPI00286B0AA0|nr:GNAT family N-acetyltransferase [Flavobacterium sp.]